MEKLLDFYSKYKEYILFTLVLVLSIGLQILSFYYFTHEINDLKTMNSEQKPVVQQEKVKKLIVDIKGEVKKPGVYYLEEGQRVIDVVKKAGGFTISADNRVNNLSKKITDEMVIIIYSKEEVRNFEKTKEEEEVVQNICTKDITNDACIAKEDSKSKEKTGDSGTKKEVNQDKKLVSINDGTLDELMTLSGVGESKAKAIIEYRTKKKFETIEEIKQVSGIGEALFEKIKENITI